MATEGIDNLKLANNNAILCTSYTFVTVFNFKRTMKTKIQTLFYSISLTSLDIFLTELSNSFFFIYFTIYHF